MHGKQALGETFVGLSDDVNSIFWNPAGLINIRNFEVTIAGALLCGNIYHGFLWICKKIDKKNSLGIGGIYLGMDEMKGYDRDGNPKSNYTANELAIILQ